MSSSQPASPSDTDRNLLFGVLALQADLISDTQFIEACAAWAARKTMSLADLLAERGWLSGDDRKLVDRLIEQKLKKHGGNVRASLGAVADAGARDLLRSVDDSAIRKSVNGLAPAAGYVLVQTAQQTIDSPPRERKRFSYTRVHAEGGLGRVWVAYDNDLNREVALKEILPDKSGNLEAQRRFLTEAQVTGQLEHPNIVPVYELARQAEDAQPFYAMRLVRGQTLLAAIAVFHDRRREGSVDPLEQRRLLGAFVDVCQAIGYAHSRGVIHRDLKPENIVLGSFGEVIVLDWGLAKMVDQAEEVESQQIAVSDDARAEATMAGRRLGTPAYMAPEQAEGRLDLIDARTDIYGLGAILFEILTGRPPHEGSDTLKVLEAIIRGDTPLARNVAATVPAALDAICAKAMAKARGERYAKAVDLADEVQRYLADQPVHAYRELLPQRMGRWVRHHQVLVASSGALLLTAVFALAVSTILIGGALAKEEKARRERVQAQVEQLRSADAQAVPTILENLAEFREEILPRLRDLWSQPDQPGQTAQRMRVGLALLPVDADLVKKPLYDWMLSVTDPREVRIVRDALKPYEMELRDGLWKLVDDPTTPSSRRFRALVALAAFDPNHERWQSSGSAVVEEFLGENPLYLGVWTLALQPVRDALIEPLREVFRGRKLADKRQVAANVLEVYTRDRLEIRADLALEADDRQYAVLLPRMLEQRDAILPVLQAELAKKPPAKATDAELDALAFRQANAAVTLLHFGLAEPVWPLLRHSKDPSVRTYIVHHLALYGIPVQVVVDRLNAKPEITEKRALFLALGEYPANRWAAGQRQSLIADLVRDFVDDPDPGIHGSAEWLLRHWRQDKEISSREERLRGKAAGSRGWYVNKQGQTFVIIPKDQVFLMGSPEQEPDRSPDEVQHRKRIPRSFALGTKEVTVAQFRRFLAASTEWKRYDTQELADLLKKWSPDADGPMVFVNWFVAAAYCNWLSKEEGIPEKEWCYPQKIGDGMQMVKGYLERTGYRLPTEVEWECACRAGAVTSRYYGRSATLLGKYAWYTKTTNDERTQRTGLLMPIDWGLFDLYGNVLEWCQDGIDASVPGKDGSAALDKEEDIREIKRNVVRVSRGGSFDVTAGYARSACRYRAPPSNRGVSLGCRVARTYR